MQRNFIAPFNGVSQVLVDKNSMCTVLHDLLLSNLMLLMPFFLMLVLTVLVVPFFFGGWNFTWQAIEFKGENFDPIKNLKRIFSPKKAAMEIIKSMFKTVVIMSAIAFYIISHKNEILSLLIETPMGAIVDGYVIEQNFVFLLTLSLVFIAAFDMLVHFFQFQTSSKMSTQELKDEHKDSEGSSDVKRRQRSAQIALLKQRLSVTVPKASVIITNPTHYAIALRYDDKKDGAPRVVAKGKDEMAQQIRYLAITNSVPIYEAPPLARAIYHTTKVNAEIHPNLYMAVAIVLSYVSQLKNYQMGRGQAPQYVSDLKIPKEFMYSE